MIDSEERKDDSKEGLPGDTIDVSELEDDELDNILSGSSEQKDDDTQQKDDDTQQKDDDTQQKDDDESLGVEKKAKKEGGDDKASHSSAEKDKKEETNAEAVASDPSVLKQLQDKENFIQRQSNELGELRKANAFMQGQMATQQQPPYRDPSVDTDAKKSIDELNYFDDPDKAVTAKVNEILRERESVVNEGNALRVQSEQNRRVVEGAVPNIKDLFDDMAILAKEDGFTDDNIASFKRDPYGTSDAQVLIQYAKRVDLLNQLKIERANKSNDGKNEDPALKNLVNMAGGDVGSLNGKTPPTSRSKTVELSESQVVGMSDSELNEYLKKAK